MRTDLELHSTAAPSTSPSAPPSAARGLDITVRTGTGSGRTLLSAFDTALHGAGVADFNLVTLSSVIPTGSRVRHVEAPLAGGHGDLLFCVRAEAFADQPGDEAWSGLGWCVDVDGAGLFVEHHASSEAAVIELIESSLEDMKRTRGGDRYGPVQTTLASARCVDDPVCAVVLAAYRVSSWDEPGESTAAPEVLSAEPGLAARHTRQHARPATSDRGSAPRSSHGHTVITAPASEPPLYDDQLVRSGATAAPVEVLRGSGPKVTVQTDVDYATAKQFYRLYRRAFGPLAIEAAARQVLHEEEFLEEMLDPRVLKYIAWDEDERAIGMTTLTRDLDTVPWISPAYFLKHYSDQVARDAVYYFGFALVDPDHQGAQVLGALVEPMAREVRDNDGVAAWDLCRINEERGFHRMYTAMLETAGGVEIDVVDQQTYYAAVFSQPS